MSQENIIFCTRVFSYSWKTKLDQQKYSTAPIVLSTYQALTTPIGLNCNMICMETLKNIFN